MVENVSSSNSTKVWDQPRIKLMNFGSTLRLTTDCPLGPGNTCISCKNVVSIKIYRSDLMVQVILKTTRSSYMLNMCHHGMYFKDFPS